MKRLPTLTKSQRRALLVIEWALLIGIVVYSVWSWQKPNTAKQVIKVRHEWYSAPVKPFTYAEKEREVETFTFDPNTADSTALLRLGLSPWQVRSIYRYRAKLGRYHTPEDFMRVPNMTVEQWERLKPYIRIAPQFRYVEPKPRKSIQALSEERIIYREQEPTKPAQETPSSTEGDMERTAKLSAGQTIDINTADTTLLKMIPGIASKRAARIVAYRNKLGGFVSVEQAMEAIEMPDTVRRYMTVSQVPVTKINVNKLSVQQLMKHPYINFYQAKAIFERRRDKGDLHTIEELSRLEAFKPTDIDRLQPYITFE